MSQVEASHTQNGFTAAELLITLIIAAVFVIGGYQLYTIVINDGAEAQYQAIASNEAYNQLRQWSEAPSRGPCSASGQQSFTKDVNGLPSPVRFDISSDCPYGGNGVARITAKVQYSYNGTQEVSHAIYQRP